VLSRSKKEIIRKVYGSGTPKNISHDLGLEPKKSSRCAETGLGVWGLGRWGVWGGFGVRGFRTVTKPSSAFRMKTSALRGPPLQCSKDIGPQGPILKVNTRSENVEGRTISIMRKKKVRKKTGLLHQIKEQNKAIEVLTTLYHTQMNLGGGSRAVVW